jgi:hypothetical protein
LIVEIVKDLQNRGRDATGLATLVDNNDLYIYKGAVPAWEWATSFEKDDVPIGRSGLLHCRGANVGSPDNNYNNHPLPYDPPDKPQVAIVHNGTIGNLDEGYEKLGVTPHAEVDSALIAASLGLLGPRNGLKHLEERSCGSAAIAALWSDGTLLLAKDGNPLYIGSPEPGALFFCSTVEPLKKFCLDKSFGIGLWNILDAPGQWFGIWNEDGTLRQTGRFNLPVMRHSPDYLRGTNRSTSQQETKTETKTTEQRAAEAATTPVEGDLAPLVNPLAEEAGRSLPLADIHDHKLEGERDRLIDVSVGEARRIGKGINVICHWGGCWRKARATLPFGSGHVALCPTHIDKASKKNGSMVLANSGELSRKRQEEIRRNA